MLIAGTLLIAIATGLFLSGLKTVIWSRPLPAARAAERNNGERESSGTSGFGDSQKTEPALIKSRHRVDQTGTHRNKDMGGAIGVRTQFEIGPDSGHDPIRQVGTATDTKPPHSTETRSETFVSTPERAEIKVVPANRDGTNAIGNAPVQGNSSDETFVFEGHFFKINGLINQPIPPNENP